MLQFKRSRSRKPMQWSPCSKYVSLLLYGTDGALLVMDTKLQTVYTWNDEAFDSPACWPCQEVASSVWSSSSTFMAAVRSTAPSLPYQLAVSWRPDGLQPSSTEVTLFNDLLAGLCADEALQCMSWSPVAGLAAITAIPQAQDAEGRDLGYELCKLYVMLPDTGLTSRLVPSGNLSYLWWPMLWSPLGGHLLLCHSKSSELVSSTCESVLQLAGQAAFTPDGRHIAGWGLRTSDCAQQPLKLWSLRSGAVVLDETWSGPGKTRLMFSSLGDLLLLGEDHCLYIMQFGRSLSTTASSRQLCKAVPVACSWLNHHFENDGFYEDYPW